MMFSIAPGTEFLMGNMWWGHSGWYTLIKGGDRSNSPVW